MEPGFIAKKICFLVVIALPVFFSSCAVLFSKKFQYLHVHCDSTLALQKIPNAVKTIDLDSMPAYQVKRSRSALTLKFKLNDSSLVDYQLKSGRSKLFVFGNLYPFFSVGHIVDMFYPNRFEYPRNNYFSYDSSRHKVIHRTLIPVNEKNTLNLRLGWSFINAYYAEPAETYPGGASPFGLSLRADYFMTKNTILFFEGGLASVPAPKRKDYYLGYGSDSIQNNSVWSSWFALGYKYQFHRFGFGAGLSLSPVNYSSDRYKVLKRDTVAPNYPDSTYLAVAGPFTKNSQVHKAGFVFNVDFKITPAVSTGVNYLLFLKDLNRSTGVYASYFFNFYLTFRLFRFNLKKPNARSPYD